VEWRSAAGLPCLITRTDRGNLCGYVAVPPGHQLHGVEEGATGFAFVVHGGLTYSGECNGHICHVPAPGEPDNVWWFGFDCSHGFDYSPGLAALERKHGPAMYGVSFLPGYSGPDEDSGRTEDYRTVEYVRAECARLAEQLAAVSR
jgi:hypothetical protein